MKRILVCGSRTWTDRTRIAEILLVLGPATIVDGGAAGADQIAHEIAAEFDWPTERYFAEWKRNGKRAGFIRNQQMIDTAPDSVVAFWDGHSRGTQDTLRRAHAANISTMVVTE